MHLFPVFVIIASFAFLPNSDAQGLKITAGIKPKDISATLQFVWESLIRWYKERVPDKEPPGMSCLLHSICKLWTNIIACNSTVHL